MSTPYLEPTEWYAGLPSVFTSACLLLTDARDHVLLVKPNYRPGWGFPGGITEAGEAPHDCAMREAAEELGVSVRAEDLLVVHWLPPSGERPRSMINFMFDGGVLSDPGRIRLQVEELDDAAFFPWDTAATLLPANIAARLPAAHRARGSRCPVYLPGEPEAAGG
ncbi:NUDIX domain-containing protein [Streptosporangium lutulentum]|uniref:8-oxo-dGTP pyrophosphatase MutT (NUDIX family) n=1 Tax=Streptosporangium lutulentum TaxID=1461250 RepID=A0ABT9Q2T9_9ACTN|nr:NUDIX hydrolase [Streptosporangium lutulentum]MDP9841047.1 8-oxo-dGTP pyrophosphatase MutT (NUDIX family) [Streptosporangium lutulentum]